MRPDSQSNQKPRTWLIGVLVVLGGLSTFLLYWGRPQFGEGKDTTLILSQGKNSQTEQPVSDRARSDRTTPQLGTNTGSVSIDSINAPVEGRSLETVVLPSDPKSTARFWELDPRVRGTYLSVAQPAPLARMLDSLTGREKENALNALREMMSDRTDPGRQQALEALLNWKTLGEETLLSVFAGAISDPDPAFVSVAIANLASREDREASSVLTRSYLSGEASTRLLIVQSVGLDSPLSSLLHQAATDPDENVRTTALAILSPGNDKSSQPTQ